MVELKVESLNIDDVSKETFVAVRVGEVQKLSKLMPARSYKFPQAAVGDRKFGRLDVFRRVGSTSVGIINSEGGEMSKEVSVALSDAPALNFRVQLGAGQPGVPDKRQQEVDKMKGAESNPKVMQAKHYLLEHNLEDRLSSAMQDVLREKPEDPAAFIFEAMKRSAGDYRRLPPATAPAGTGGGGGGLAVPGSRADFQKLPSVGGVMRSPRLMQGAAATVAPAAVSAEEMRTHAKEALLIAMAEGKLGQPLQSSLAPREGQVEALRQEAAAVISKASLDGSLENTLALQVRALRQEAAAVISKASLDGSLENTLALQVEALRQEAAAVISKASLDGSLENTLQKAIGNAANAKFNERDMSEPEQRQLVMIPTQVLYGQVFPGTGMTPNFVCR